eukprot:TRINITY_DN34162_c0_g1_i1.p1 TRINITY_DN34162_c0_g1~~TRINITY_DN34162_c0_g1_i1.p1  ORF type:complete len:528 (+),score=74.67 TRINITY_DN34162_c0_g1_i1:50-1633(+)
MDIKPELVGNMMGGLLQWLTDEVKEMQAWREQCKAEIGTLTLDYSTLKQKCDTLQLRSIQQKMGILKAQGRILESQTSSSIRAIFFKKLKAYRKHNIGKRRRKSQSHTTMLVVLSSSSICMQQRYFTTWLRWQAERAEVTKKIRHCMAIQLRSESYARALYFDMLKKYRSRRMLRRVITNRLSTITETASMRIHYSLLSRYRQNRQVRKHIEAAVLSMSTSSHHALLSISWRKLQKHAKNNHALRRKSITNLRALTNFIKTTETGVRLYAYKTWLSFTDKRKSRTQRELLSDMSRKIGKLTDKISSESEAIRNMKKAISEIEEKVGSEKKDLFDNEVISSIKFSLSENERSVHLLDTKCREVEVQSTASLREAMREVDDIISTIRSDQVTNARQAKSSLLSSLTSLEEETSNRMIKLEKTLADLLTADRHQIKHDFDSRTESLSKEFLDTRNQVDLSLKSLANTNTVLNKVVNRMISIDHHLEELDRTRNSTVSTTYPRDISPIRQQFDPVTGRPIDDVAHQLRRHE